VRAGRFGVEEDTSFLQSAAALGLQVIVYSFAAIGIVMSALVNQALLPSTIPMVVYDALAILSYYDLTHLIPWPTQMEATLVRRMRSHDAQCSLRGVARCTLAWGTRSYLELCACAALAVACDTLTRRSAMCVCIVLAYLFDTSAQVTMTKYVHPSMYEGLSLSPGTCASAYRFNLGYLCLLYGQLGIVLFTLAVALYADFLRRQVGSDWGLARGPVSE